MPEEKIPTGNEKDFEPEKDKENGSQGETKIEGGKEDAFQPDKQDNPGAGSNGTDAKADRKPRGKGGNGRGDKKGKGNGGEGTHSQTGEGNPGLGIEIVFNTSTSGKSLVKSDMDKGAITLKGESLSTVEEAQGQMYVGKATPTNLQYEKTSFVDYQGVLATRLNEANLPEQDVDSDTGIMYKIDAREELIAIPTIPVAEESKVEYMRNDTVNDNGVVTLDSESKAPIGGQFLGTTMVIGEKKIKSIHLIDFTPSQLNGENVDYVDTTMEDVSGLAHYRNREEALAYKMFEKHEGGKNSGVVKNPIYRSPESQTKLITLLDIARDTTSILEKSFITANEFIVSISQERYHYGQDVSKRKNYIWEKVAPILDFKNDGKKINTTSDLVNTPFLVGIVDEAKKAFDESKYLYCYPKTTIALKPHLQGLFKWRKKSLDHRSIAERCVNAFTTNFLYSNVTTVDGVQDTEHGIGGAISRSYLSMDNGNIVPHPIIHPVFDGIAQEISERPLKGHIWNTKGKDCSIVLTFDPEFPTFAFLVLRSIGKILTNLQNLLLDVTSYLEDGGSLPSTFVRYPVDNLTKFLNECKYDETGRHDSRVGETVEVCPNGNLRMRYPETALLIRENSDNEKSLYEYRPGFITPYTVETSNDGKKFTGRLAFPAGQSVINPIEYVNVIDPVIAVNNASFRQTVAKLTSTLDAGLPRKRLSSAVMLENVTVKEWLTARRLIGIVYAIPCGIVPFDTNAHVMKDGSVSNLRSGANDAKAIQVKLGAADCKAIEGGMTTGVQLSSHRLRFAVPVDKVKAVKVEVTNQFGTSTKLSECVLNAYKRGGITQNVGFAGYVIKGTVTDAITTTATPAMLVKFPFCWSDTTDALQPYLSLDKWGYHAKFFRSYTNPFVRIREEKKVGDDTPMKVVPHQFIVNDVYYWMELSAEEVMEKDRVRMDSNDDYLEPSVFFAGL